MKGHCAYCGEACEGKTALELSAKVAVHIQTCEKHPFGKAAKIMAELIRHGQCPCKVKVSKEYADAYSAASAFVRGMGITL